MADGGIDITVKGGQQFQDLGRRLREQGEAGKGLRKELYKAIDRATKPLRDEVKKAEAERWPRKGGLARRASGVPIRTSKRNVGNAAGIRLVQGGKNLRQLRQMDAGTVRHPTFGHKPWKDQPITPGVWTETLDSSQTKDDVRRALTAAMQATSDKIH